MPARIVFVHDDLAFLEHASTALRLAGHDLMTFSGSMEALRALENSQTVELLITQIRFPTGTPHGIALARMARTKRPGIRIVFAARQDMAEFTDGLGEFLAYPIDIPALVETANRLLDVPGRL